MVCSMPLSNNETSFAVIGFADPLARVATTFIVVVASPVGCACRPACANKVEIKLAKDKTHNIILAGRRRQLTAFRKLPGRGSLNITNTTQDFFESLLEPLSLCLDFSLEEFGLGVDNSFATF